MFKIIFWLFFIVGLLFAFDIPQNLYYAIKKRGNKIEEVKPDGRTCYYDRDDTDNN